MHRRRILALGFLSLTLGCGSSSRTSVPSAPASASAARLEGQVLRGPITPVCRLDVPCSAGFSATFQVYRASQLVSEFTTDAQGNFGLSLAPGTYTVVPPSNAPIMNARSQTRTVVVGDQGVTRVVLEFDTGIR
jgi:hypothetical protein